MKNGVQLSDNLTVLGDLRINNQITELPDNLTVGGCMYVWNTPLADKYSKAEIERAIRNKGGKVKEVVTELDKS